jgi:hypothetical protein
MVRVRFPVGVIFFRIHPHCPCYQLSLLCNGYGIIPVRNARRTFIIEAGNLCSCTIIAFLYYKQEILQNWYQINHSHALMHNNHKQYHWKFSSIVIIAFHCCALPLPTNSNFGFEVIMNYLISRCRTAEWKLLSVWRRFNATLCSH